MEIKNAINLEDLDFILSKYDNTSNLTNEQREDIFLKLELDKIEINNDDPFTKQIQFIYDEIELKLEELGVL